MKFMQSLSNKALLLLSLCLMEGTIQGIVLASLGGNCIIAGVFRDMRLRKNAYPFDWMYSDFESVYQAIADNFQHFLDDDSLRVGSNNRTIIDFYGLKFVHDFPTILHPAALSDSNVPAEATIRDDWRQFIKPIKQKYQRRINRLRGALNGSEPVYLVRGDMKRDEAIRLRNLLMNRYPHLNFTLIAVCTSKDNDEVDWKLNKIRNFCVKYVTPNFYPNWQKIFNTFGINSSNTRSANEEDDIDDILECDGTCGYYH